MSRGDGQLMVSKIGGAIQPAPRMRFFWFRWMSLFSIAAFSTGIRAGDFTSGQNPGICTNVIQLRTLSDEDFLRPCSFRLVGTVTWVDTNREWLVLQDSTGAVVLSAESTNLAVQPGTRVSVDGREASPYVVRFPDYPYRPSGWDIQPAFDAPMNWGDYHLTRMRGYLHPPVTGEYTFWIASDDSSELWLSTDNDPAKVRKIATVQQGQWVNPHEWSHYSSQRSEPVALRAGQDYYIEAFQDQIILGDHVSVAWSGPGLNRAVIAGCYLTPWMEDRRQKPFAVTNGILREYWTNYTAGGLSGITGPRHFDSRLSVNEVRLTILGSGPMPEPRPIPPDQPLRPEDNYCWVEINGQVSFAAANRNVAVLELSNGQTPVQVHVGSGNPDWVHRVRNRYVRVRGVYEGDYDTPQILTPGLIWASGTDDVQLIEAPKTNRTTMRAALPGHPAAPTTNTTVRGVYYLRGVVTFNDRVFGRHCLFVQDEWGGGVFIAPAGHQPEPELQTGERVEIGGNLLSGGRALAIRPVTVTPLGRGTMPVPIAGPTDVAMEVNNDNQWMEIQGVVRSVDPNGTLEIMGKRGLVSAWVGGISINNLKGYVDSTLRIRGVMSLSTFDKPMLLAPSRDFIEVDETPSEDPFTAPARTIASLKESDPNVPWVHRAKVTGQVIGRTVDYLLVQDNSSGAAAQIAKGAEFNPGDWVELVGFPEADNGILVLTKALARRVGSASPLKPIMLELADLFAEKPVGTVVRFKGGLLTQKNRSGSQILELQEGQNILEAILPENKGRLPAMASGSRLLVTGICMTEPDNSAAAKNIGGAEYSSTASLQIWLRTPDDVKLLAGPPLWTWERVVILVGTLLVILISSLLWIYLLRRRLERQQAQRRAFSRQILQSQEAERRRIAGNLHDSLGQNLLVIKNQTRLAMQPAKESVLRQRLTEISEMAARSLDEVRQITHDLRPYQLDRLGLTQALRAAINRVSENSPILFASHVDDVDGLFDKESEIHVYRIVQEAINNIIKHSGANEAVVVIKRQADSVSLSIRDNGRGFATGPAASPEPRGFGLSGMDERIQMLNGKLTVGSRTGQGVSLNVEIPISKPSHES